jgi:hypothetical protein
MKKKIIFILFSLYSSIVFSQNFEGFKGYLITNNNDTIKCTYSSISNIFKERLFNPATLNNKVEIVKDSIYTKYKPKDLKSFLIINPRGTGDFKFVSAQFDGFKHFYQEIAVGRISCYRSYYQDGYALEYHSDILVINNKKVKIGAFNRRKDLGKLIEDYPELYEKWMNTENYKVDQFGDVLRLYNEHFKYK